MADNFSSSYNETKSFDGETTTEKRIQQRKTEKKLPRKTKKTHVQKKDSGSEYKSINRQRSGQSTILMLKPELKSQEKEKETKKEIEKKQLKKENQDNETKAAKNEEQQDKPEIEKLDEQESPKEVTDIYSETGKNPTYLEKKNKKLDERLKKKTESKQEIQVDHKREEKNEPKEDWEILLEKWINEADEAEIPDKIKKELIEKIKKFRKLREIERNLIQLLAKKSLSEKEIGESKRLIKNWNELHNDLFENLRAFREFYNKNISWYEYRIKAKRGKFIKYLAQKLNNLRQIEKSNKSIFSNEYTLENWKEILKENLYKNTTLSLNEKSIINKIIRKGKLIESEKKELLSILSKLPTEQLISLLGNDFRQHTHNYVKWGWDYEQAVKKLMLNNYLFNYNQNRLRSSKKLVSLKNNLIEQKQNLEKNDRNYRKCSYCNQFLPIENFDRYGSERGKKGGKQSYRSICKNCRRKKKSIRELRKKLRLILEFFDGKCKECNVSLIYLPSFEFHHIDKLLKKTSWRKINYRAYKKLAQWVINEKVIPLCGNCHLQKQVKYLHEFKELILKKNLFTYSQEIIEHLIDKAINNHILFKNIRDKSMIKYQIKRWIRKRYVIEQLYDGKCVVCGLDAIENLSSIVFHHLIESLKKSKWQDLQDLDCVDILNKLTEEKCVSLCSNCHSVLHSTFYANFKIILKDLYTENEIRIFTIELDKILNNINKKISNFKFNLETVNFKSPLKYRIPQKDIWKIQTLKIFYFSKKTKKNMFRIKEIMNLFNRNYHNAYEIISKLVKRGYLNKLKREGLTQNYYVFTGDGIKKVKEFQQKFMHIIGKFSEEQIKINDNQLDNHRMENDDILNIYPKIIMKIIKNKGYNEFLIKELANELGKTPGHISKILKEKLIPNGYIKVKTPPYITKIRGNTKVYSLTDEILDSLEI